MATMPNGGPQHREEDMYAYMGGAAPMPVDAPYNRWEEWMLWLAQSGSGAVALSAIAPEFDDTTSYTAGDYVIYDGTLYKFTADHTGAWDAADATATDVGDELKQAQIQTGEITMSATWSGSGPYIQTVTVSGATVSANSMISLQPTAAQLTQLISDGVTALTVENNGGVLTVYALGAAPTTALTIACTVAEVE